MIDDPAELIAPTPSPAPKDEEVRNQRFLAALDRVQHEECSEISAEVRRARSLLQEAAANLVRSFHQLSADTLSQQKQVQSLLADMSGAVRDDGVEGVNIPAFVAQTAQVMQTFTEVLVHFSKQSVTISYKIDDMVEHMDAIFELVSQVDSMAEETNILAINAALEAARAGEAGKGFQVVASEVRMLSRDTKLLNEKIGGRVDSARAVIDDVREAAREIASQDMSLALNAKGGVDEMLTRLQGMDTQIGSTLDDLASFTERVRTSANDAVRSMQFEDMVTQILEHVDKRTDRLRTLIARVREGASQQVGEETLLDSLTEQQSTEGPRKVVEQESMNAGDVELF